MTQDKGPKFPEPAYGPMPSTHRIAWDVMLAIALLLKCHGRDTARPTAMDERLGALARQHDEQQGEGCGECLDVEERHFGRCRSEKSGRNHTCEEVGLDCEVIWRVRLLPDQPCCQKAIVETLIGREYRCVLANCNVISNDLSAQGVVHRSISMMRHPRCATTTNPTSKLARTFMRFYSCCNRPVGRGSNGGCRENGGDCGELSERQYRRSS
jgi:hypothetical protein